MGHHRVIEVAGETSDTFRCVQGLAVPGGLEQVPVGS